MNEPISKPGMENSSSPGAAGNLDVSPRGNSDAKLRAVSWGGVWRGGPPDQWNWSSGNAGLKIERNLFILRSMLCRCIAVHVHIVRSPLETVPFRPIRRQMKIC